MYIYLLNEPRYEVNNVFKMNDDKYLLESSVELEVKENERSFEVIDGEAEIATGSFVVFNNVPVSKEGKKIFEERFKNRPRRIENEPGFKAIRVCRPLNSDTYVIMSFWESEEAFESWRKSEAYKHTHRKRGTSEGIDQQHASIFPRPSYVETYRL